MELSGIIIPRPAGVYKDFVGPGGVFGHFPISRGKMLEFFMKVVKILEAVPRSPG